MYAYNVFVWMFWGCLWDAFGMSLRCHQDTFWIFVKLFHSLVFPFCTIGHKWTAFQAIGSTILSNQRSLWHCMLYCRASWGQPHLSFMLFLQLDFWMFFVISKVHKIQFHKLHYENKFTKFLSFGFN